MSPSRFVAEFVTQANFLPAQRRGELWETEVGFFNLGTSSLTPLHGNPATCELMIREEDLMIKPGEVDAPVVILTRRFLDREYRYCLQTPSGKELHARTTASTVLPVGARVKLTVAAKSD